MREIGCSDGLVDLVMILWCKEKWGMFSESRPVSGSKWWASVRNQVRGGDWTSPSSQDIFPLIRRVSICR